MIEGLLREQLRQAKRINRLTHKIEDDTLFLTAAQFNTGFGSPTLSSIGAAGWASASWLLDDSALAELVGVAVEYRGPKSGNLILGDVWWASVPTTGNVRIALGIDAVADGEAITGSATVEYQTVAVPTAGLCKKTTFEISEDYEPGDLIKVMFVRYGSDGADTAVGDLHFIAVTLRFSNE